MSGVAPSAVLLVYHLGVIAAHAARALGPPPGSADVSIEPEPAPPGECPLPVDVVVPARNERQTLEACVRSLLVQRGVRVHVTVVDDHSDDGTREIAETLAHGDARVRVVCAPPLPAGWTGKAHAIDRGVETTEAPWLLFVDADVIVHPDGVATALRAACRRGTDVLSVSPFQRAESVAERLVQPAVFALLDERFSMAAVNDPSRPVAAVNGQFLLFRREAYRAVGGHASVRGDVLEDVALARRAKQAGLSLFFGRTDALVAARMYRSFGALCEGWSKNLFLLLGARVGSALGIALRDLVLWVLPVATAPVTWALAARSTLGVPGAVVAAGALLALFADAGRRAHRPHGVYRFLVPFGTLMVIVLIVRSWWQHTVARSVSWKGRRYAPDRAAGKR